MKSPLAGRVAIVTGASSGVGRALALGLAAEEAVVCLVARRLDALTALAEFARANGTQVEVCPADLTIDADVERLVHTINDKFGRVDLLVHSAGIFELGPIESAPVKSLDDQYRCNVRAPFVLTQALLPLLKKCQGHIVFVNSTAGLEARPKVGQYAATKHALKAISDSLRQEINAYGVRVSNLFLGRTATPMQEAIFRAEGRTYAPENLLQPEDVASLLIGLLRLPRTAEVTEVHIRPAVKSY